MIGKSMNRRFARCAPLAIGACRQCLDRALAAFIAVKEEWAAEDSHNRDLLRLANLEIIKFQAMR